MTIAGPRPSPLRRALTLHLPMAAIVLFAIGPYLWMLLTSLRVESTLFSPQRTLLPDTLTTANYLRLFTKTTFTVNLLHSLVVALGTVADIVPLVDENRMFVRKGLQVMEGMRREGLRALRALQ